jgi:hypothetical protein
VMFKRQVIFKQYTSNSIIIINFMWTLPPNC